MMSAAELDESGCAHWQGAVSAAEIGAMTRLLPDVTGAGLRLALAHDLVGRALPAMTAVAHRHRHGARPVRAVLFDKSAHRNWVVPWHQDRTIAVAERVDVTGFGPWSIKDGCLHVEPPFLLLAKMITLRQHFDPCPTGNAPLRVALRSHRERVASADAATRAAALDHLLCVAEAGDIWAYATPILHCSDRAGTPSRRRVLQIDFTDAELPGGLAWAA